MTKHAANGKDPQPAPVRELGDGSYVVHSPRQAYRAADYNPKVRQALKEVGSAVRAIRSGEAKK